MLLMPEIDTIFSVLPMKWQKAKDSMDAQRNLTNCRNWYRFDQVFWFFLNSRLLFWVAIHAVFAKLAIAVSKTAK